jgi:nitroimidazol reductase NimA-like FMN-containing flavoprotein (pyridoxamine 5'-phosphate oxidase superfamily)
VCRFARAFKRFNNPVYMAFQMDETGLVDDGLSDMENILNRADVGRIALFDGTMPYIIPLNFIYTDGKIVFHCAWEGRKLDIISMNPNCCFEVDEFVGEVGYHYESRCHLDYDSVLAFGCARIEDNDETKVKLLQLLSEKYDELYNKPVSEGGTRFTREQVTECCCVIIDVFELTGRREVTVDGKRKKIKWHKKLK